tara:strand:+ start:128 stop:997 length:870 start_codon:yes stop_codon:yes gene_type:complete
MDPFTLALATFGIQKLRGKSTKTALKDAALIGGGSYAVGALTPNVGATSMFRKPAFSSMGFKGGLPKILGEPKMTEAMVKAKGLEGEAAAKALQGTGIAGMSTGTKLAAAGFILPFLEGEEDSGETPGYTKKDYEDAYKEQSAKLEGKFEPVAAELPSDVFPTSMPQNMFYANQGGLATALPKYNEGGVNYLPSKIDHDENDVNNYVRASGYVEDGSGTGDKDEDTMLAQLADGEFVSRADAVLGAGILSGGDPKSFKSMRKAGADFFYDQQKKFKRVYDLVNASKTEN